MRVGNFIQMTPDWFREYQNNENYKWTQLEDIACCMGKQMLKAELIKVKTICPDPLNPMGRNSIVSAEVVALHPDKCNNFMYKFKNEMIAFDIDEDAQDKLMEMLNSVLKGDS